jgi:hypothetical protein
MAANLNPANNIDTIIFNFLKLRAPIASDEDINTYMEQLTPAEIDYLVKNIRHYMYFIRLAARGIDINTFFSKTSIFAYTIIRRVSRIYAKINNATNTSFNMNFINIFIPDRTRPSIIAHRHVYSLNNVYPRLPPSTARPASARANAANARANVRANARANAINARNIPNPSTKRTVTFRNNGSRNNANNRSRNNANNGNNGNNGNNVNGYNANNENNTNKAVNRAKTVKRAKTANTRPAN